MKLQINKLFPDRIEPFRFGCGVIYKAHFDSINCPCSYFGVVDELYLWWIDCRKGNFLVSGGAVYPLSFLDSSTLFTEHHAIKPIDEFERPDYEEKVGAIQFLIQQSAQTGKLYSELELEILNG